MNNTGLVNNNKIITYDTGAKRDLPEIHGRCDLLPLSVVKNILHDRSSFLSHINDFIYIGDNKNLYAAVEEFIRLAYKHGIDAVLELSQHYKNCLVKYPERNWEKGIPIHSYIDSAVRHFFKWQRGDNDENHAVAVLWNLVGAIWTTDQLPELNDMPHTMTKEAENDVESTQDNFH